MQLAEGDRGYNFLYLYFAERKTGGGPEKDSELPGRHSLTDQHPYPMSSASSL